MENVKNVIKKVFKGIGIGVLGAAAFIITIASTIFFSIIFPSILGAGVVLGTMATLKLPISGEVGKIVLVIMIMITTNMKLLIDRQARENKKMVKEAIEYYIEKDKENRELERAMEKVEEIRETINSTEKEMRQYQEMINRAR